MAIMTGVFRLGKDMEVRYSPDGRPIGSLSLAYNYGKKGSDGKRPTQWIKAAIFDDRCESLEPYLKKGTALFLTLEDPRIETWDKDSGGQGFNLVAKVGLLEFAGGGQQQENKQSMQNSNVDDNSDIPFD